MRSFWWWNVALTVVFLALFPCRFSATLIMIVALDRVFIITKAQVYKKYITMKVLYWIIMLCLLLNIVMVALCIMEITLELISSTVIHILLSGELCFIFIIIMVYIYLFHFVRSNTRKIANKRHGGINFNISNTRKVANKRHGGINFNKKLMMTITYIYICLLVFILPHFVGIIIGPFIPIKDC